MANISSAAVNVLAPAGFASSMHFRPLREMHKNLTLGAMYNPTV